MYSNFYLTTKILVNLQFLNIIKISNYFVKVFKKITKVKLKNVTYHNQLKIFNKILYLYYNFFKLKKKLQIKLK